MPALRGVLLNINEVVFMGKSNKWIYAGVTIFLLVVLAVVFMFALGITSLSMSALTCTTNKTCSTSLTVSGIPTPDSDFQTDGTISEIFCQSYIMDSSGNYKFEGQQQEITTTNSFTDTVSFTPTATGNYAYGAACVETNNTYDLEGAAAGTCTGANCWKGWTPKGQEKVVAGDQGQIIVTGPNVPTPNQPNVDVLSTAWGHIQKLICKYFGWFC